MSIIESRPCGCGCGSEAPAAKRTNARLGHTKGIPLRFVSGHNKRGTTNLNRYVVAPNGCWNWTGPLNEKGYGKVQIDGHSTPAHRAIWEASHWTLDPKIHVDHKCLNTQCVNPAHMRIATALENNESKRVPLKVDRETARLIKMAEGTHAAIAARFGISRQYVAGIKHGTRRASALELLDAMIDPAQS
ncbi:HNH endonuclease signature motif containing protein [Pseudarthrobacter sp. P1]|uniref:HNH endonuclease signature motif containing protein n=1 Tax=Pseudarthrobacter sp. P1 TaxID=3418418 RepID=UPI003CF75199